MTKWTAVEPVHKERHFIVTDLMHDAAGAITGCQLEAVINKNAYAIDWRKLEDEKCWTAGWV
jgi:tryptophan-rich hypothetical protein